MRCCYCTFFFFQAEDGIRDWSVTGVQTCALPILVCFPGPTWTFCDQEQPHAPRAPENRISQKVQVGPGKQTSFCLRTPGQGHFARSEERRVGKEGRCRGWT